jgi:type IV pilus assembly protein PilA
MRKNKRFKGFTLVELLAVIVVLGIILIIAIPNITGIISQTKVNAYNAQMDLFKDAANKYVMQFSNELGDANNASVSLGTLMSKNLIDKNVKNPINNNSYGNVNVTIRKSGNSIVYGLLEGPNLLTGMIPVYYDEAVGVWKKADVNNSGNAWFNYAKQQWANAVTVTSANRAEYQSAAVGTPIPMDDINTMFVWILDINI